ncbi:hypothetical protein R6Q59_029678 [Mikania micrantha]
MADSDDESGGHDADRDFSAREQDRFLPIANVSRIMKKEWPANAKISKDAKETVQVCLSAFISFITGEASDKSHRSRKAESSEDGRRIRSLKAGTQKQSEGRKQAQVGDFTAKHWSKAAKQGGRRGAVDSWRAVGRESFPSTKDFGILGGLECG